MKLLKELALGNIQPMVRNFKKDGVYAKLLAEVTERQESRICSLNFYRWFLLSACGMREGCDTMEAKNSDAEAFVWKTKSDSGII